MTNNRPSGREPICIGRLVLIARMDACARAIVSAHIRPDGVLVLTANAVPTLPRWNNAYMAVLRSCRLQPLNPDSKLDVYGRYMDERPDDFQKAYSVAIRCMVVPDQRDLALYAAGLGPFPPHVI